MSDSINHPAHYTKHPSGVECIAIVEHFGFCVGNAIKYLWRAGLKGDALEDLRKAAWYVAREIERREQAGKCADPCRYEDSTVCGGCEAKGADLEFVECPSCAAKPGSPVLCAECLERRRAYGALDEVLRSLKKEMARVRTPRGGR